MEKETVRTIVTEARGAREPAGEGDQYGNFEA